MNNIGYIRTLAGTNIPKGKFTLIIMAIYAEEDRTIRKRHASMKFLANRTQVSCATAYRNMEQLENDGLIKPVEKKRVKYWQLPSEQELMNFTAKKKAKKKRSNLFKRSEAQVPAPVPKQQ